MRRAAKTDTNQGEIVNGLRSIFGPECVFDASGMGKGFPDLVIGVRGKTLLMEVKTKTGKLTTDQIIFHKLWDGQIAVVTTLEEALQVIAKETT